MARVYGTGSPYLRRKSLILALAGLAVFVFIEAAAFSMHFLSPLPADLALLGILSILAIIAYARGRFEVIGDRFFNFFDGMSGEDSVVKILRELPDDYAVFRNLQIPPHGDVDIAVVGPTGVFALEVKSHVGKIGFDGQELTRYGRPFAEKDFLQQAMNAALALHTYLANALKRDIWRLSTFRGARA